MNINGYLRKVYTIAFRLTGDENIAANLAFNAISNSSSYLNFSDNVDFNMLKQSANEICRMFLTDTDKEIKLFKRFEKNTYADPIQDALMSLNTICRTTVVWRDILGLKLDDININGYSKKELYLELNKGRKILKDLLNEDYLNETGA